MYEQYLEKTTELIKDIFIKMTALKVIGHSVEQNKRKVIIYPVATTHTYENNETNLTGKFVFGLNDKMTAEFIAKALGKKAGIDEKDCDEKMKSELLAEFINTIVGHVITDWSKLGLKLKFKTPVFGPMAKKEANAENYLILLNLENNMYISIGMTFDQVENLDMKNKKIMVVDDSMAIRHVISKIFLTAGCIVEQAVDGIDAVEKFQKFSPDLIVMDLVMPRQDGLQTIAQIRKIEKNKTIIFMLTSTATDEQTQRAQELGVSCYFIKPVNTDIIFNTASSALTGKSVPFRL